MYTVNIYEETTILLTLNSPIFTYTVSKQGDYNRLFVHISLDVKDGVTYANMLIPKLETPLNIEVLKDNDVILSLFDLPLIDINVNGAIEYNGFNLTFKKD